MFTCCNIISSREAVFNLLRIHSQDFEQEHLVLAYTKNVDLFS